MNGAVVRCDTTSTRNLPGMLHPMRIKLRNFISQRRRGAEGVKIKAIMKGKNTLPNGPKFEKLPAPPRLCETIKYGVFA